MCRLAAAHGSVITEAGESGALLRGFGGPGVTEPLAACGCGEQLERVRE
jgi:hypothetical protein